MGGIVSELGGLFFPCSQGVDEEEAGEDPIPRNAGPRGNAGKSSTIPPTPSGQFVEEATGHHGIPRVITGLTSLRLASYRRYASVVRFIMVDSIGMLRWRGPVASALTLGGPVLQIVVLAIVLSYSSAITAGGDREILGWHPRESS